MRLGIAEPPQLEALGALVGWAKRRALEPATIVGLEAVIAAFAADPEAPDLELVMRVARAPGAPLPERTMIQLGRSGTRCRERGARKRTGARGCPARERLAGRARLNPACDPWALRA